MLWQRQAPIGRAARTPCATKPSAASTCKTVRCCARCWSRWPMARTFAVGDPPPGGGRRVLAGVAGRFASRSTNGRQLCRRRPAPIQPWATRLQAHMPALRSSSELACWQAQLQRRANDLPCERPNGAASKTASRTRLEHRSGHRANPPTAATGAGGLPHPGQRPAADRTGPRPQPLERAAQSALIQLEGHGREELFDDIDLTRTVGWFTSLFPVRLTPAADLGGIDQGDQGATARRSRTKAWATACCATWAMPQVRADAGGVAATAHHLQLPGPVRPSFDERRVVHPGQRSQRCWRRTRQAPLANWLSVNGQVYGGELKLTGASAANVRHARPSKRWPTNTRANSMALIDHC